MIWFRCLRNRNRRSSPPITGKDRTGQAGQRPDLSPLEARKVHGYRYLGYICASKLSPIPNILSSISIHRDQLLSTSSLDPPSIQHLALLNRSSSASNASSRQHRTRLHLHKEDYINLGIHTLLTLAPYCVHHSLIGRNRSFRRSIIIPDFSTSTCNEHRHKTTSRHGGANRGRPKVAPLAT